MKYAISALCVFIFFSCNKYLDVQPTDRLLDKQVFGSKSSIQKALNGIYINLISDDLYGGKLSATVVDVLAQYYNAPGQNRFGTTGRYQYNGGAFIEPDLADIWRSGYTLILNSNEFIQGVSKASGDILNPEEKDLMLGEAQALRAFVAFDMLRLFGPVYSADSAEKLVPYPILPETKSSQLLAANEMIVKLIADLQSAAVLLKQDPIIQNGVQPLSTGNISDNFFKARNRRMNYYAVKALLARVHLYRGDKVSALQNATEVIAAGSSIFPWTPEANTRPGIEAPDRVFSSEIILGPENPLRDKMYNNYFSASNMQVSGTTYLGNATLLAPLEGRLAAVYENQENDYRLRSSWRKDATSNYSFKTFTKYQPLNANYLGVYPAYRNIQPLVRISELYLIAAECTNNQAEAVKYLNTLRENRGLINPIPSTANIEEEITKEYKKEFWGEGQLFFYYKRKNKPAIENGSATSGTIAMTKAIYVVPLPLIEIKYR